MRYIRVFAVRDSYARSPCFFRLRSLSFVSVTSSSLRLRASLLLLSFRFPVFVCPSQCFPLPSFVPFFRVSFSVQSTRAFPTFLSFGSSSCHFLYCHLFLQTLGQNLM